MRPVFFAYESPRPAVLLRIALGIVLLAEAISRWPYAVELYSSAGPAMPALPGSVFVPPVPTPATAVMLHTLLVFGLACVVAGWQTRLSLWLAFGLSAWLGLLDSPGTFKKYSVISLHMLLLLSFTQCGAVWSVDRWHNRRKFDRIRLSPAWPRWLMRVLLASVYLGAAVTKLKLPDFATGDLLMFALLDDLWGGTWLGQWLAVRPGLLPVLSLATILFELAFPLLVWVPQMRRPMLLCAVLFHVTLAMTMHLGNFSPVMLAALLAFVNERDLAWLRPIDSKVRSSQEGTSRSTQGRPVLISFAAYLIASAAVTYLGLHMQQRFDWYDVFGDRRRVEYTLLSADEIDVMLAEQQPALADYVHRVDLGNRISGGRVFGGPDEFRRGATVYAAARLVPQHPPLKTTWLLIAPDGREVARLSRPVESAVAYATAGFKMPEDAPVGRYRVVLQIDGYDAANRWFELAED